MINLRIGGERIIAPGGNSGAQSGDSLPDISSGALFAQFLYGYMNYDTSDEPGATLVCTCILDQGFDAADTVPDRIMVVT